MSFFESLFFKIGKTIAGNPFIVIFLVVLTCLILSIGLLLVEFDVNF